MAEAVGVTLPVEDGLPAGEYVEPAQLAERSGYNAVLAGEVAGPDVFSLLGMIAARTSWTRRPLAWRRGPRPTGGARDRGLRAHDCSGENREACAWWRWTTWPA